MTLRDAIAPAVGFSSCAHVEATWLEYAHLTSMRSRRCPRQQQRGGGVDMLPFLLLESFSMDGFRYTVLRHLVGRGSLVLYRHQAMSVVEAVDQYLSEQPPFWLVQVKLLTCRHQMASAMTWGDFRTRDCIWPTHCAGSSGAEAK